MNYIKDSCHGCHFLDSWLSVRSLKNGLNTGFIGH
nr:MAG TPA: Cytochrome C' [Caudoviricetes sp.]DAP06857.1 MAG TPA: Cytochrome C' [Caudoviricetes sp.]